MDRWWISIRWGMSVLIAIGGYANVGSAQPPVTPPASLATTPEQFLVTQFCLDCHNQDESAGGLTLEGVSPAEIGPNENEIWERVVRKLRTRQMPPASAPRPTEALYEAAVTSLETSLDRAASEKPNPGRTDTFRRLNRTEYQNAIRDLLALEVDVSALLPADESSHGFDNVTVGGLSPTLLDRYLSAAQKISRLAVGRSHPFPDSQTIRLRADVTQEEHVEGLPLGTRGGALIPYTFPQDGDYEIQIRLARDRNEEVEGLTEPHELELLLDRARMHSFTVAPARKRQGSQFVDQHLVVRIPVAAGPHELGVTFLKNPSSLLETKRQPYQAHFNMHRHPRISPAIYQISITGPYAAKGVGDTPSRRRIFVCRPMSPSEEEACAKRILTTLIQRSYRRPASDEDLRKPMELYREARAAEDFEAGIEMALSGILVSPRFLFRIEQDPADIAPHTAYAISDLELASRLSFFVWSSIPDDELLELAIRGGLRQPGRLQQQVRRMLADSRSRSLASNFAGQWLHLRNLEGLTPDLRLFPDFDDNLRQAFRRETELTVDAVLRQDRSVLDLLKSESTFLNERLAKHYGIPHVYGSRFRRVDLREVGAGGDGIRGGLLRHGSVLSVTSYATRTSPVIRGKWILDNLLGTPPPPPPANVPALKDNTVSATLSIRERLKEHRENVACASCHTLMDPIGFALENFDAVGRWRTVDAGEPVDSEGGLPDGSQFVGVAGLEKALLNRPEIFVGTLAEKLLTYAVGRGVEPFDGPAIRKVVRDARSDDYRFSSLILGIVTSTPFQMRRSE